MSLRNDLKEYDNINPLIVIGGATAAGKSALAVELADNIGGEIVSADSMQVYRHMDIGTAKPSEEEKGGIPHYMIDVVNPDSEFNVAVFKEMAEGCINEIRLRGKIPIVVGGTGFYINALIKGTEFKEKGIDGKIRQYYELQAAKQGREYVHKILESLDPAAAYAIHKNNVKRVIRALEYFESTGESIIDHNISEKMKTPGKGIKLFILDYNREELYRKINKRVDIMMEKGLVEEVRSLLNMGYSENLTSMQAIGYKEIIKYFNGEYSLEHAADLIKQHTRNYAKRQVTWFKHQTNGVIISGQKAGDVIREVWNKR